MADYPYSKLYEDEFAQAFKSGWSAGDYVSNALSPFSPLNGAPPIISFTITPNNGGAGGPALLSWSVPWGAVSIDNGIGVVANQGTRVVNPGVTTTYTLTATSLRGKVSTAPVTYTVSGATDPLWANVLLLAQVNTGVIADMKARHTFGAGAGAVTVSGSDMVFNGASSLLINGNQGDFAFPAAFTLEAWGTTNDVPGNYYQLLDFYDNDTVNWVWYAPPTGAGFYSGGTRFFEGGVAANRPGTHHFCAQKTVGVPETAVYMDGIRIGAFTDNSAYGACGHPLTLGSNGALNSQFYNGTMKGVRVTGAQRYTVTGGNITPDTWPVPTA